MSAAWPGWDTAPQQVGLKPRRSSDVRRPRAAQPAVVIDQYGQLMPVVDEFGRVRSASVSGQRPAQIIINNDNGAQNSEYRQESHSRPRASSHHRHNSSAQYEIPIGRRRSNSRRISRGSFSDDYSDDEIYVDERGMNVRVYRQHGHRGSRHRRSSSSSRESKERKPKRRPSDEAALKRLEELDKEREAEEQRKLVEKEIALKRLKDEEAKARRAEEDKDLKEKVIEEYKLKQAEEEAKKRKAQEEEEEKMIRLVLAGSPGWTESQARKYVRRAGRAQERVARGEPEELEPSISMGMGGISGGMALVPTQRQPSVTHIKVHNRHISTETLEAFNISYEWDNKDPGYLIIKRWLSEDDQEILFNHTKQLKQRARLEYPRKGDTNQIVIVKKDDEKKRKKSPIKRTSWFLT